MDLKYYVEKLWYKVIYMMVVILYLVCLNKLNHKLLKQNFESSFMLLAYNNYAALKYFVIGLILFAIGCMILYREVKRLKRVEDFREIIIVIATIIVVFALIVLIYIFIDNPILRAVLVSCIMIFCAVEVATN